MRSVGPPEDFRRSDSYRSSRDVEPASRDPRKFDRNMFCKASTNSAPIILPTSISSTMIVSSNHDRSFFICKELLMTERTYKKDLELIGKHFRREMMAMINQPQDFYFDEKDQFENETLIHLSDALFTHWLPIFNFHLHFLRQLEQRVSLW